MLRDQAQPGHGQGKRVSKTTIEKGETACDSKAHVITAEAQAMNENSFEANMNQYEQRNIYSKQTPSQMCEMCSNTAKPNMIRESYALNRGLPNCWMCSRPKKRGGIMIVSRMTLNRELVACRDTSMIKEILFLQLMSTNRKQYHQRDQTHPSSFQKPR